MNDSSGRNEAMREKDGGENLVRGGKAAGARPSQAAKGKITKDGKAPHPFISDIEPFLFARSITYVDVGAHVGSVLKALSRSVISVREAHLIEPNPKTFAALQEAVSGISVANYLSCHNVAISAAAGRVAMRDEGTMTHIVAAEGRTAGLSDRVFEVETITLDELARRCEIHHIGLLKVDVEGHELEVFEGAKRLLETESIDIIYVEAGMNPDSKQHSYYRAIEDALRAHGYRLFRIYEQSNEWLEDSPLLRRVNLTFMSAGFTANNPYKATRKLFELREREGALAAEIASLKRALDSRSGLEREVAALRATAGALVTDRDAFVRYADQLERAHQQMLRKRSWRMMEPLRSVVRKAKGVLTGRPYAASPLPTRPQPVSSITLPPASKTVELSILDEFDDEL